MSILCNRFGHRQVVISGGLVCFVGMISSGFVTSLGYLYITISIVGKNPLFV